MIIRIKRGTKYAHIPKELLHDKRLSWKAKGILCYLLGHSDDWECRVGDVVHHSTDGYSAVQSAVKELKRYHYARTVVCRDPKAGRLTGKKLFLYERPFTKKEAATEGQVFCSSENLPVTRSYLSDTHSKYDLRRDGKHRSNGNGFFGGGSPNEGRSLAQLLVKRFSDFTIKHRLHIGRNGSTRFGWRKDILQQWESDLQKLLEQIEDSEEFERTMTWYFLHWKDEFTPKCYTMRSFCSRYADILHAIGRANRRNGEREYDEGPKIISIEEK